MPNHIKFPSFNQYRQIVKSIRSSAEYHGVSYPTVTFEATVKLHGSNFSVVRPVGGTIDDIWVQSRESIITPFQDNAGLAMFAHANKELFNRLFDLIEQHSGETDKTKFVQIFGEGCGANIQKGVGITGLPKMINIFGIRISETAESSDWKQKAFYESVFTSELLVELNESNIYTKYQFPHWYVDIDFNKPEEAQNTLVDLCMSVEKDCPVARYFKPDAEPDSLVGEGIVIAPIQRDDIGFDVTSHFAKIKGSRHANSHVKTLASIDPEKVASVDAFVEYAMTENRLQQGLSKLDEMGLPKELSSMGKILSWVVSDAIREELDTLAASGLTPKDVTGKLSVKARNFYLEQLL